MNRLTRRTVLLTLIALIALGASPTTSTRPLPDLTLVQQQQLERAMQLDRQAGGFSQRGLDTEAVIVAQEAADLRREILGPDDSRYAWSLNSLGMLCGLAGDWQGAERAYRTAADIEARALGREDPSYRESQWQLAGALGMLANAAVARVDFQTARQLRHEAVRIITTLYGANDYRTIDARVLLALVDQQAGLGADKRRELRHGSDLLTKANQLAQENTIAPAVDACKEALAIYTTILGAEDSSTIDAMEQLARLCDRAGDATAAGDMLHRAVERRAKVLGRDHPAYLESRVNELLRLADRDEARQDFQDAAESRQEALGLLRKYHAPLDWQVVNASHALAYDQQVLALPLDKRAALTQADRQLMDADALGREGRFDDALRMAQQAFQTRQELLGKDHLECAGTLQVIAGLCVARKDFEQAVKYQGMATDLRIRVLGLQHPETQRSEGDLCQDMEWLSGQRQQSGNLAGARMVEEQLLAAQTRLLGPTHWKVVTTRVWMNYIDRVLSMDAPTRATRARGDELWRRAQEMERNGDLKGAVGPFRQAIALEAQAMGEGSDVWADMVYHLGDVTQACGDMPSAADAFRRCAEARERLLGRDHPMWSDAMERRVIPLDSVVAQAWEAKDYAAAIRLADELIAVQSDLHGPHDWRVADAKLDQSSARAFLALSPEQTRELEQSRALDDQGAALSRENMWAEAADRARRAMEIRRRLMGVTARDIDTFADLATVYDGLADGRAADEARRQSVELRKQLLGPAHPDYLLFQADFYRQQANRALWNDDLAAARKLAQESLDTQMRALPPGSWELRETQYFIEYVDIVGALSAQKRQELKRLNEREAKLAAEARTGNAAAAIDEYRTILTERGKLVGADGLAYATSLLQFGALCYDADDFAQAEKLLTQAVDIRGKWLGEQSGPVVEVLVQLAQVYSDWNDLPRARQTSERAFNICVALMQRTVHGPSAQAMSAQTMDTLFQYSVSQMIAGFEDMPDPRQRAAAAASTVPMMQLLCKTAERTLPGNPVRIYGLRLLGKLYTLTGDLPLAQRAIEEAVASAAQLLGPNSIECAATKHNLASVLFYERRYDEAMKLAHEVAQAMEKARGPESAPMAETFELIAKIHQAAGRYDEAIAAERRALQIQQKCLNRVFAFSSEAEMANYADSASPSLELLLSMVRQRNEDGGWRMENGLIFNPLSSTLYPLSCARKLSSPDCGPVALSGPDVDDALSWVLRRKAIVMTTLFRVREAQAAQLRDPNLASQAQELRRLRQQINDIATKPPKGWSPWQVQDICSRLRGRADALEGEVNRAVAAATTRPTTAPTGAGFERVRRALPNGWALVEMVRARVANFRPTDSVSSWKDAHYYAMVLSADPAAPARMVDLGNAGEIDALVGRLRHEFRKLDEDDDEAAREADFRGAAGQLYARVFAPLVPVLGSARHIYISPDGQLNLVPFEALAKENGPYLIEEGYQFAYLSGGRDLLRPKCDPGKGTVVFADPDYDLGVKEREELTKVVLASETPASDSVLRGVHPTDVRGLQFKRLKATTQEAADVQQSLDHSVYGPVKRFERERALRDVFKNLHGPRILHVATHGYYKPENADHADRFSPRSNPLLRSVLAFAGANVTREDAAGDDGLITAEEVSLVDLRGTELVVLSACESGLGDVKNAEGVYGLRRAFLNAGARTLVTSLFEVPDAATQQLMSDFYRSLRDSNRKLESLHRAQLKMIQQRRKAGGAAHPFYWASFILVGEA